MAFKDPFNAFVDIAPELGPGPRLAVKDMIAVEGLLQTAGLPVRAARRALRDAHVVSRFRAGGYAITGTTATDAAGFGTMTAEVRNPRFPGRAVGGSSGGSAAAVAGGLADIGLGTDTGGSVRIPAAYCDLVALKPTAGRTDMDGVVPFSRSFDVLGVLARNFADLAAAAPHLVDDWAGGDGGAPRFAYAVDEVEAAAPAVARHFEAVRRRFAAEPVPSPCPYESVAMAHSDLVCAEALAVHRAEWESEREGFPPIVAAGLLHAQTLGEAHLATARRTIAEAREAWRAAIPEDRILLLPTLPMAPAMRTADSAVVRGADMPITNANIRLTGTFNVAGLPVVVAPVDGLSVQFVGPAGRDEWLLATVRALVAAEAPV